MIKPFILATIFTFISHHSFVKAEDLDVCKLWRSGGNDWWSPEPTYCCKDCCLTTLTSADDCTKALCKTCPKHEDGQCTTFIDPETKEIVTNGCKSNQFCKYTHGSDNGAFKCENKLVNNATCQNDLECQSDHCYMRHQKRKFCFGCIAGNNPDRPSTYQIELTDYCDKQSEWCDDQTYTCKAKLDNGMNCPSNNQSCKSMSCHPKRNVCVACLDNSQCSKGLTCSEYGHCEVVKKDVGEKCTNTSECSDDHICREGRCQGFRGIGARCDTHYHCDSNYCNTKTKLCYDPNQKDSTKSPVGSIMAGVMTTILVASVVYLCYRFYKKRKGLRSKKALRSSKQLAEELFSPEGQSRAAEDKLNGQNSKTDDGEQISDDEDVYEDNILESKNRIQKQPRNNINDVTEDSIDNS